MVVTGTVPFPLFYCLLEVSRKNNFEVRTRCADVACSKTVNSTHAAIEAALAFLRRGVQQGRGANVAAQQTCEPVQEEHLNTRVLSDLLPLPTQLPDAMESVEDAEVRAQQQRQPQVSKGGAGGFGCRPNGHAGDRRRGREDGLSEETATPAEAAGGVSQSPGGQSTRPGSAPSARFEPCVVCF